MVWKGESPARKKRWAIGIEEEEEEEKVFCAHFLSLLLFRTDGKGQKMTIIVSSVWDPFPVHSSQCARLRNKVTCQQETRILIS